MKKLVILSGGLDSTIMTHVLHANCMGRDLSAISFNYGQKQTAELVCAVKTCEQLGIDHKIIRMSFIPDMLKGVSSNIKGSVIDVPTIDEVLGDPQPVTYVPFRNMMMISIAFSYAEAIGAEEVYCGLQQNDEYNYWDTTQRFIKSINSVASQNRKNPIELLAPFSDMTKADEIKLFTSMKPIEKLHSLTCYNPTESGVSCGKCPSCSERLANFKLAGIKDPNEYA